ncbi:MAG: ATP-grasp domain-containing protein [Chloroflexi bacterium]|nr:ATP-grasp domain-containing protein [Chloroflexota bacterium]
MTQERPKLFTRLLIANRGEIAVRIARACRSLGVRSVAVYSDADRGALHVRACDEAYNIGPAPASESYLRGDKIIEVARAAGCEAIHPGYGFLSENANFAAAVIEAGIVWVGPQPEAIRLMGSKIESKRLAEASGVPVVPGYWGDDQSLGRLTEEAQRIGYPVLIKASAGGGGKGMRVVNDRKGLAEAIEGAQREAQAAFGDSSIMLEMYLTEPRHIEVQVLGDSFGNLVHLGERDCTVQRRHQKVVEESPSPAINVELRAQITGSALALAKAAGYSNAGTVEFIFQDGRYYFLEMNTRLQVEHPVTEEALGLDLVEAQIRIAAGEKLWLRQNDVAFKRHALEVRLYAEDPDHGFLPSTGTINRLQLPPVKNIRVDAGVGQGDTISPYYDPMIAKIIGWGDSRAAAIDHMSEMLGGTILEGVTTNLGFLRWLMWQPQFRSARFSTRLIEQYYTPAEHAELPIEVIIAGAVIRLLAPGIVSAGHNEPKATWQAQGWRQARQNMPANLVVDGERYDIRLSALAEKPEGWWAVVSQGGQALYDDELTLTLPKGADPFSRVESAIQIQLAESLTRYSLKIDGTQLNSFSLRWEERDYWIRSAPALATDRLSKSLGVGSENSLESPMPGKVLKVLAKAGEMVAEEQPLVIIEAMKMEFTVRAPHDGVVAEVRYSEGDQVTVGDTLIEMEK